MLLRHGESVLRSAYAVLEGEDSPSAARGAGVLYLTNQRLVFEAPRSRGFTKARSTSVLLDVSLHDVRNVDVPRRRLGRDRFVVELALGRPTFDVLDPSAWAGEVARAKRALAPPGSVGPTIVERHVVKVRCRYCGTLGNEVDAKCLSCGASL